MKNLFKCFFLLLFILCISNFSLYSQKRDSVRNLNVPEVPDKERIPPKVNITEDTVSKKLKGGALIDTVSNKPKTRFPKDIDDRQDSLKNFK